MGIEKGAVLQEARVFNDPQVDPRRCSQVITKLLYLLNQGESFTKVSSFLLCGFAFMFMENCICLLILSRWSLFHMQVEATEVFFSVTKLFQSKDTGLRRMVYLIIKELSPSSDEVCKSYSISKWKSWHLFIVGIFSDKLFGFSPIGYHCNKLPDEGYEQ